jgi:hypothetical protein
MSTPKDGSHHDLFEIEKVFKKMGDQLKSADIDIRGFFLNADAGFDSYELRTICSQNEIEANIKMNPRNTKQKSQETHFFDEKLYQKRIVIERVNAWIDGFRVLINRRLMGISCTILYRGHKQTIRQLKQQVLILISRVT